ncbi:hypothetical protein G6F65_013531 [Rhizopus arrhizus]|nr:hypothetical protein G6F65_013531 [Rhizopus arrhizus]
MPAHSSGLAMKSAGIILIRFIIRIQKKIVMAIGADLDEGLPLARHAGGGLAGAQPERDHDHQAHQDRGEEGIDVDMPEHTLTLADRRGQVVQVMLDVAGRG